MRGAGAGLEGFEAHDRLMAIRGYAFDSDLGEDTYTTPPEHELSVAQHTIVPSTTFFSIGMCAASLGAGALSTPKFQDSLTTIDMSSRASSDYAMSLVVKTFVYGPSDSGLDQVVTLNFGTS